MHVLGGDVWDGHQADGGLVPVPRPPIQHLHYVWPGAQQVQQRGEAQPAESDHVVDQVAVVALELLKGGGRH